MVTDEDDGVVCSVYDQDYPIDRLGGTETLVVYEIVGGINDSPGTMPAAEVSVITLYHSIPIALGVVSRITGTARKFRGGSTRDSRVSTGWVLYYIILSYRISSTSEVVVIKQWRNAVETP